MSGSMAALEGVRVADLNPLIAELAKVLPKDHKFTVHHLSTTPTATDHLCYPPASIPRPSGDTTTQSKERRPSKPLKTYCEKHFLTVSIGAGKEDTSDRQVLVLGLEIYIYSTSFSTIIFVSKADSTGYLNLLNLPKGTPSPIREVTTCFVAFLISNRSRPTKQLVVNLFARAQSQYLFPGSVKNNGKHVLDDRGLVKWWCRVLNTMFEGDDYSEIRKPWDGIHGYLVIPGLDDYETRASLPRTSLASTNWTLGDPLEIMSPYTKDSASFGRHIHLRSLIPTYPDDPKARFVEELEESTPHKVKLLRGWTSPKTLDQFWEMMAFRQECSSGRLTGFIWVVFEPQVTSKSPSPAISSAAVIPTPDTSFGVPRTNALTTLQPSQQEAASLVAPATSSTLVMRPKRRKRQSKKKGKKLSGRIIPRKPRFKTHYSVQFPKLVETPYYSWPENGRGQVVLNDNDYKRAVELLLHLEFGTLEQAIASTARWTKDVNMGKNWALEIVGQRAVLSPPTTSVDGSATNDLSAMVKRKRSVSEHASGGTTSSTPPVNTLSGGLIRKKAKLDTSSTADTSADNPGQDDSSVAESEPKVNVLEGGLVRKKPKAS
ncbi:histone acetylation protein-domain-containing protein [Hypoxylon rubiginosum]|uniref:Histone acetylation protein-domain-containing protein n=1 Tax=Hypoxylon rubiginosum TaxID=110542 RepID=A0ACB9YRL4_9PEZI|nr:histone acetylation protein-domain-containing protein [Hypoxylon rubiginosum]